MIPSQGAKIPHAMIKLAKTNKGKNPKVFRVAFSIPFSFPYKLFIPKKIIIWLKELSFMLTIWKLTLLTK